MEIKTIPQIQRWTKKEFKPTVLKIIDYKQSKYLQIGKKKRIDLKKTLLSKEIELQIEINEKLKQFCFELVYDKEIVLLCRDEETMLYWINEIGKFSKCNGIFGYPLQCSINKSNWKLPIPIFRALQFLQKTNGKESEGIFRLSGNHVTLQKIKKILDNEQDIDFNSFDDYKIASSLIKDYLRSLPESLIPFSFYFEFIEIPHKKNGKHIIEQLPIENQNVLFFLCDFLFEIMKNEEKTKMNAANLATCVGLTISRPPLFEQINELEHTKNVIASFEYVMNNYCEIFKDIKERNENEGMIPPEYPCVVPRQKIPFGKLINGIKQSIKEDEKSRSRRNSKKRMSISSKDELNDSNEQTLSPRARNELINTSLTKKMEKAKLNQQINQISNSKEFLKEMPQSAKPKKKLSMRDLSSKISLKEKSKEKKNEQQQEQFELLRLQNIEIEKLRKENEFLKEQLKQVTEERDQLQLKLASSSHSKRNRPLSSDSISAPNSPALGKPSREFIKVEKHPMKTKTIPISIKQHSQAVVPEEEKKEHDECVIDNDIDIVQLELSKDQSKTPSQNNSRMNTDDIEDLESSSDEDN